MLRVRHPQDFWSGLLFVAFGASAAWVGRDYEIGTFTHMGPGFLPTVLSCLLIIFGVFMCARGVTVEGEALSGSRWRPQIMIVIAIVLFALTIERLGLAPAIIITVVVAGLASDEMRWKESISLAVGMAILSLLLFIYLLGQAIKPWDWTF
jgi:hypothetical protein